MIIVTGGAGFIGSNLIYELNKMSEKNIVICDLVNSILKKDYLKKIKYKKTCTKKSIYTLQYIV